jgi:DNA-binding transcriptional regulator YiaG
MIHGVIKDLGLSHHQAARVFGVSYAALHSWLVGVRQPSTASLEKIAVGLAAHSEAAAVQALRVRKLLDRTT